VQSAADQRSGRCSAMPPDAHSVTENSPIGHYRSVMSAFATGRSFGVNVPAEHRVRSDSDGYSLWAALSTRESSLPCKAASALPTATGLDRAALQPWISRPQSALIFPCASAAASRTSALLRGDEQRGRADELTARGARSRRRRGSSEPGLGRESADLLAGKIAANTGAFPTLVRRICWPTTIATAPRSTSDRVGENPTERPDFRPRSVLGPCHSESAEHQPIDADECLSKNAIGSPADTGRIERPADKTSPSVTGIRPALARAHRPAVHPIEPDTSVHVRRYRLFIAPRDYRFQSRQIAAWMMLPSHSRATPSVRVVAQKSSGGFSARSPASASGDLGTVAAGTCLISPVRMPNRPRLNTGSKAVYTFGFAP